MGTHYVKGNLLEADVDYICHQVNCQGKMNSGIAKSIREKYPAVYSFYQYEYQEAKEEALKNSPPEWELNPGDILLGKSKIVHDVDKSIVNMFAQDYYGYDGKRYTSYDAFWSCLGEILDSVPKGSKIGFPDHIGCCRGGANWEVIRTMIEQALGKDYEVYIYKLEE